MVNVAISIAGSEASGGAGAQTDIKTFHELGTFGAVAYSVGSNGSAVLLALAQLVLSFYAVIALFIAIVLAVLGFNLSKEFKQSHRLFSNDMSWLIENPRNRKTTYDLSPEQLARWEATHGKAIAELKAQAKNPSPPPAIAPAPVAAFLAMRSASAGL